MRMRVLLSNAGGVHFRSGLHFRVRVELCLQNYVYYKCEFDTCIERTQMQGVCREEVEGKVK
jgi:hypothetical protein